jgi:hypothetical protein
MIRFDGSAVDAASLQAMACRIRHRGPDACPAEATPPVRADRRLQVDEWDSFAMQYRDLGSRFQTWKWRTKAIFVALLARQFGRAYRLLRGVFSSPRSRVELGRCPEAR